MKKLVSSGQSVVCRDLYLPTSCSRGFTLIEMVVVLAIIAIVTSITLFGQGTFNRSVVLTDAAYTVAFSLRQAQTLGISSRKYGTVQNAGYGGRFVPLSTSYLVFADIGGGGAATNCPVGVAGTPELKPGNCIYNAGTDGILNAYVFDKGFSISKVCGTETSGGAYVCSNTTPTLTALDVLFIRSNTTDAILTAQKAGVSVPLTKAEIYLQSATGAITRGICVSLLGQISVTTTTCP